MSKITRRRFFEDSLLAAAGAAAATGMVPLLQPRLVSAQVSANDKLGVMIVGCGDRGNSHIAGFTSDPRTTILYLCDPDPTRTSDKKLQDIAEKQDGLVPKVVKDMREALSDKNLDIVSCATTNHWHALTGIWAMQAEKHCYLEKPVCHNVHEGQALVAASKKYNKVVQTGMQCRTIKANIDAVEFTRAGGIGEIKFARGLCYKRRAAIGPLGEYDVPETVDYDLWSGPAPIVPLTRPRFHYDWHWQRLYGNGDMGNQGPHQADVARWHLGMDRFPNSVITYGGRLGYQAEKQDDNYVDAGDTANTEVSIFDYGDKCMVFETRGLETPDLQGVKIGVIVYGSEGYLVQKEYNFSIAFDLKGNVLKEFRGGGDQTHYGNFIDAVVKGDPDAVTATARCGALSAGLSHLGNISYYLGEKNKISADELRKRLADVKSLDDNAQTLARTLEHLTTNGVDLAKTPLSLGPMLQFDPDKEVFTNNADANKMLTREYRKPYVVPVIS
ncbi:MAG: Gfo/Idh/MocA family oxidoreductase [Planctomycetaceae bacterium]|nr:Gfo/Idh/MocA family oxidoreductase [Planctomycetaceae bacterium]